MKQIRFLLLPLFAAMLLFVTSCGDNEDTSDNDALTTDSTNNTPATTDTVAVAPSAPVSLMLAKHKVSNFAKWKAVYDEGDSMRMANGLHNFVIGRGVPDSNTVLVAVKVDDMEKAKSFSKDPALKKAMQKSGVVGAPTIMFLNVPYMEATQTSDMRRMTSITVKDWDAWRKTFESNRQTRLDNGLSDRAFGHDVDDNHKVIVVTNIIDSAKANAFMTSDILKQNMKESGVVGAPTRFTYRVVQSYQ